ncbi:MAG: carbohydrate ABC transporter permease [Clostridiaceae bacterium]|nr:carbohydrate ABC transporter permease [Clostridiaceae bacterium]
MVKSSKSDRTYYIVAYFILSLSFLLILLPFMNLIAISLSGEAEVLSGSVTFWPRDFIVEAYRYVVSSSQFFTSFMVTLIITVVGSLVGVLLAVSAAYPLSKKNLPGRKFIMLLFVITMLFSGGIIPTYILINKMKLLNSIWAIIFPMVNSVFNLLIVKNYFESLPEEIGESAQIDGATHFTTLFSIMLPIAKPVLATITLFYAVSFWNEYFTARLYITKQSMMPLQLYLRTVIFEAMDPTGNFALDGENIKNVASQTIINATIILSMLPMVILYPFLQRYFTKGIIIGSVKG